MYTGALENYAELIEQMAWVAPLWGNPGDVLEAVRSPWQLAAVLRDAGLLFPETRPSPDGLLRDGTWLEKSYRGASGSGVRVFGRERGTGNREHTSSSLGVSPEPPACYQRHIAGTPGSAVFVATAGSASLLGVTRQRIGDPCLGAHGFQYAGSMGPWQITDAAAATIAHIGNVLAVRFELIGLFGVDFVLDGDQIWTLEVNPRYTASVEIVERATGVQAVRAHAEACAEGLGDGGWGQPGFVAPSPYFHGKAILFAKRDFTITNEFAEATLAEALRTPWPTLADIPPAGSQIDRGRPVLTLFAEGRTVDEVEQQLRDRAAELESQIYHEPH
jgi:predicted ATP-grasp superfamily ATP-dependent carboligase